MYMEGTKFELMCWDNPQHMHRTMLFMGIGINWHSEGEQDSPEYTESFDVIDSSYPENSREGLTRSQVDSYTWGLYWDEQCK